MIRVGLAGASGKMGRTLQDLISHRQDMVCAGAIARVASASAALPVVTNVADLDSPDVVIDFSEPGFAMEVARQCARAGVALVSGTTGFAPKDFLQLEELAEQIPMLWAANMSLGVNLMTILSEWVAGILPDFDVEIVEAHHRHKKDAPSGTALRLGEAVATGRGRRLEDVAIYDRSEVRQARDPDAIGFAVIRGGDIVGDHSVLFAGDGELLTLSHRATSRATFASGALLAARWLVLQKPGFYSMSDALELDRRFQALLQRQTGHRGGDSA
jgi:4-hydroxy-tetrahydrodipicolinate reductase